MGHADPHVPIAGIDQVPVVGRTVDKGLEQVFQVIDTVNADVFTKHRPLGGDADGHVRAVGQLILTCHCVGPGSGACGEFTVDGQRSKADVGPQVVDELNEFLFVLDGCGRRGRSCRVGRKA